MALVPEDDLPQSLRGLVPEDDLPEALQPRRKKQPEKQERTWVEAAKDVGAGLVKGAGSVVQLPGQLYGQATGDFGDYGSLGAGKAIEKFGEEMKSPELKRREAVRAEKIARAEQEGGQLAAFKTALGESVTDPALLTSFVAEQVPPMIVPFGLGRATKAGMLARGAGELEANVAAVTAGKTGAAVQQGADIATGAYENIYNELIKKGTPPDQAKDEALSLARKAGIAAAGISYLAQKLPGGETIERALAGVPGKGSRVMRGIKGGAGELTSENVEEVGGKLLQNVALQQVKPEQSLTAGLGETAAMATIGGGALGGVSGLLTSSQKAEIEKAKDVAEETGKAQEVTLQLPYNKDVTTGTYGTTTIVVNPDGSTSFPSEKNKFAPSTTAELTEKGLKEKYTPQKVEDILSGKTEAYASEEDRARVESYRADEARRSSKAMKALDDLIAKRQTQPKEEARKAAESSFNTVMDNSVLASFGIGPTARLRKEGTLEGLDIRNPDDANKVKTTLELYKEKASQGIKTKIEDYLKRPEFTGAEPEVSGAAIAPTTPNVIAFIPRGSSEVKTYTGNVVKKGDNYVVEYDRGEGRKDTKALDPARILVNPTPDEIELMNIHKEITRLLAEPDVFKKFVMKQGISPDLKQDLGAGDLRVSPFIRAGGLQLDQLASRAVDQGLLTSTGDDVQDANIMADMLTDMLQGRYVMAGSNAENYAKLDKLYGAIDQIVERGRIPNEEDIASFVADEERQRQQDRAVEEMYMADEAGVTDFALKQPTPEELQAQELAKSEAVKAEEQAVAKADKEAKEARAKKEIAQASEKASGQFELGKTAEENLSGQKDIFAEAPKVRRTTKEVAKKTEQLSQELKEMPRKDMNEFERELMDIADKIESYGEDGSGFRAAVKSGRIKADKDLEFYRKREQEYAARVGKAKEKPSEKISMSDFAKGYENDVKRLIESKGLFATETSDMLEMANDYLQQLTDAINEAGYKVLDVTSNAPTKVKDLRNKMSEIAGSMNRLLKENEALSKGYERANENKYNATLKILANDFKEVDQMLGNKEEFSFSEVRETPEARKIADEFNGTVVYNKGDLSLIRAYAQLSGAPVYIPARGDFYINKDIDAIQKTGLVTDEEKAELRDVKKKLEEEDAALHKKSPFIKFTNGFAKSEGVPSNLAGVLNGWKGMLGLGDVNIYVTTLQDAKENRMKFTGPHRVIGSSTLNANDNGSMRRMGDGSYYISFNKGTSRAKMLETLAHELGHIHEREMYIRATPEMRHKLVQEHKKWLENQKGKTARELVDSLRARATAKTTKVRAGAMADNLTPYWKSFSEWYADQVSRWATTSEKPMTVVEKFFDKLARSIRNFFNKIKNAGYLPNETFKQYLDDIASKNLIIDLKKTDPISEPVQGELFSRTKAEEMKLGEISDKEYEGLIKQQFAQKKVPFKQRWEELRPNLYDRIIKGLFDEFRFIKKYSPEAYMKARLSKSIDGALEGLLYYGQVKLTDGALDIKQGTKGLIDIYKPLGNEIDQYQIWKALNRDARMPADRRSFDDRLVAGRAKLVEGEIDGKPRVDVYRDVLKEENALNKSVLDVARAQGLIDEDAYKTFSEDIYYIPFYKVMEEDDNIIAISAPGKLTGQYFSKKLKGGEKQTNDLMENVLMNWSHILSASMKNKAGVDTLQAAEAMGAAQKVKSTYEGKDVIKVVEDGKQAYYAVSDPDLVDSISLISYMGPKSAFLDVAKGFTNALRFGVTLSPAYKVRNLIRDSIQSASVSEIGLNVMDNVRKGLMLSDRGNPTFMSALVGGGVFEMGVAHEGDQAKLIKRLIDKGVKQDTILDNPKKIKDFLGKAFEWYNEQGNRFENANRLALYDKLRKEGKSHLEASYASRDLMDFSLQGSFRAIKVVSQVVPFFNARLQGLYKLGRDGVTPTYRVIYNMTTGQEVDATDKQKAQRFMAVTSSVMLASMLLYMQFKDDEDFKRREDWDRDNFWWFKVNDVIFRVPKPFEIGAAGTIAERTLEQIVDKDVEGKVFGRRMQAMLADTFSMNPTPQAFKPLIDLYANKDSFTGAPIESSGMERLSKQERYTDNTSALAKALGGISQAGARVLTLSSDAEGLSPVQVDYAIKAYFGWAGSTAASISDKAVQPWSDVEKPGKPVIDTLAMGFVKTVPETQSKWVTQFYETDKLVNQAFADMKRYAANGEADKVAEIMAEKGDLIALQKIYDRTAKQLAEYRKYEHVIAIDKQMPKEEKELQLQRIKILISDTAMTLEQARVRMKQ